MIKRSNFAALLVLAATFCLGGVWAQQPAPPQVVISPLASDGKAGDVRWQTFDIVWRTVKEKHFDPKLGGVDWNRVREQYAPRVAAIQSDRELHRLLQEMLGELRQSHFNIIPPESVTAEDQLERSGAGIGVDLRLINDAAVITRVEAGSSAARAGLRPGFIIKQIDGQAVEQMIQSFAPGAGWQGLRNVRLTRRILAAINGHPDAAAKIVYLDDRDQRREAMVARERLKGEWSPSFGHFPPQYTEFEAKRLANGANGANGTSYIGYIRFNIFTTPVIEKLKAAISGFGDADALIVDLRGNPGGVGAIALTIANRLCAQPGSLGAMKMRGGEMRFAVSPQANPYHGPVVILIDGLSGSTSEIFSGGLREMGRAVVVGERSAGAALPSYFQKLPTGALFQFAIADFKTPQGVLIEGRGVSPDLEVKWNRASLLAGRDAQLEAAVEQARRLQQTPRRKNRAVK